MRALSVLADGDDTGLRLLIGRTKLAQVRMDHGRSDAARKGKEWPFTVHRPPAAATGLRRAFLDYATFCKAIAVLVSSTLPAISPLLRILSIAVSLISHSPT